MNRSIRTIRTQNLFDFERIHVEVRLGGIIGDGGVLGLSLVGRRPDGIGRRKRKRRRRKRKRRKRKRMWRMRKRRQK